MDTNANDEFLQLHDLKTHFYRSKQEWSFGGGLGTVKAVDGVSLTLARGVKSSGWWVNQVVGSPRWADTILQLIPPDCWNSRPGGTNPERLGGFRTAESPH
jgi:hypothetical protein